MRSTILFLGALILSGAIYAENVAPRLYSTVSAAGAYHDFGKCRSGCGFFVSDESGGDAGALLGIESAGSLFGATEIGFLSKSAFASVAAGWRAGDFSLRLGYTVGGHDTRLSDQVPGFSRQNSGADMRMPFAEIAYRGMFVRYGLGAVKADARFVERLEDDDAEPEKFGRQRKDRYSQFLIGWRWKFNIL